MTKTEAIQKAGTMTALAKLLGISVPAVSQWRVMPEKRIWQLKVVKPEWFNEDTSGNPKSNPEDGAEPRDHPAGLPALGHAGSDQPGTQGAS